MHDITVVREPLFIPQDCDAADVQLLWHYTTTSYRSFSTSNGGATIIDQTLKTQVVEQALASPFLLDCVLGLTAMHLKFLGQDAAAAAAPAVSKLALYRARAFEGYRAAVQRADPRTFPSLVVCSLMICALSSDMFRGDDARPLYIVDWITVWRGIGLMINLTTPRALTQSGVGALFLRPPIDLNTSALHVPSNLLFMVSSLKPADPDYAHAATYYDTLKYLGSLYKELATTGFGPVLDIRIITFFTFLPFEFVDLARQRRPRALVIIAHHLVFMRVVRKTWWLAGIPEQELPAICDQLLPRHHWDPYLRVPRAAIRIREPTEVARLLINNHEWEPPGADAPPADKEWDPRDFHLGWVDNSGQMRTLHDDAPGQQPAAAEKGSGV